MPFNAMDTSSHSGTSPTVGGKGTSCSSGSESQLSCFTPTGKVIVKEREREREREREKERKKETVPKHPQANFDMILCQLVQHGAEM